jgi:hypothetical protein
MVFAGAGSGSGIRRFRLNWRFLSLSMFNNSWSWCLMEAAGAPAGFAQNAVLSRIAGWTSGERCIASGEQWMFQPELIMRLVKFSNAVAVSGHVQTRHAPGVAS